MKRHQRMKEGRDFARLRKEGRRQVGRYFVLSYLRDPKVGGFRAGLITTKRIGNAVARNRARRRMRALVDSVSSDLDQGTLMVIIARFRVPEASFDDLERDWQRLVKRARLVQV